MIGDSHAGQLRSAFDDVASTLGWRGYAISRNSCAYAQTGRPLPAPYFDQCVTFKQQVPQWLAQHPEVTTVFVVGLTRDVGGDPVTSVTDAWDALPKTVTQLIPIRDTPEMLPGTMACVQAAERPRQPCAVPATRRCTTTRRWPRHSKKASNDRPHPLLLRCHACFPVIGGVLVHKDMTHVTPTFARTLGPYLVTQVRRIAQ